MSTKNLPLNCKQAVDLISRKEEGRVNAGQRLRLYRHFEECSLCRLFNFQNKVLTTTVSREAQNMNIELPPADKERMINRILREGDE